MKATRKSTATPPKFHVGQRCRLVLDAKSGWPQLNGELCTITCGRRKMDLWCHDWDGSNRNLQRGTERYEITLADGSGLCVRESQLRARYDGEERSTWDKFEKLTGIKLRGELVTVKRARRPKSTA